MTEEKNHTSTGSVADKTQTRVELQIIPCEKKAVPDNKGTSPMNHESQDDPCLSLVGC